MLIDIYNKSNNCVR